LPENIDNNTRFGAKDIGEALQSVTPMLGYVGLDALISELEALSLELYNDRKSYRLDEVRTALERAFGEATVLLFDRIKNELVGGSE
jgi:hypothetical protein